MLTDAYVDQVFMKRVAEIDQAIIAESARWGDIMRADQPYTRDDWLVEIDHLRDQFFGRASGSRESVTLDQMRSAGWLGDLLSALVILKDEAIEIRKSSIFAVDATTIILHEKASTEYNQMDLDVV